MVLYQQSNIFVHPNLVVAEIKLIKRQSDALNLCYAESFKKYYSMIRHTQ